MKTIRMIAILLAAVMVLPMAACVGTITPGNGTTTQSGDTTTPGSDAPTTETPAGNTTEADPAQTTPEEDVTSDQEPITEEPEKLVTYFSKTDKNIKIIYASGTGANVRTTDVTSLINAINTRFGMSLKSATDKTTKESASNKEILLGVTNRQASVSAAQGLSASDYAIKLTGNQLVIVGGSETATAKAIRFVISEYLREENATVFCVPEALNIRWIFAERAAGAVELARDYRIVYGSAATSKERSLATGFASSLAECTGMKVSAIADSRVQNGGTAYAKDVEVAGKELLIGSTNRKETNEVVKDLDALDWEIRCMGDKIVVVGGSYDSTAAAINHLSNLLLEETVQSLRAETLNKKYIQLNYVVDVTRPAADYSKFTPVWASSYTPPAWMTNQTEKLYAVTAPDARNMSASAGGDIINYPSHSLEALTSAVKAGADLLVVNVWQTKDGVAVVAPSDDLKYYTNAKALAGTGGRPLSTTLTDWTLEQLSALRYISSSTGKETESGICSLYEVVNLCRGRCLLSVTFGGDDLTESFKATLQNLDAFDCYYEIDPVGPNMATPHVLRTLESWAKDTKLTAPSLAKAISNYKTNLNVKNHWMRRLFEMSSSVIRRDAKNMFDSINLRAWAEQGYNFFYTVDIVGYCRYIATQESSLVNEDLRPRSTTYTIEKNDLDGRILILSDTHYYPKNNSLGYTKEEKMQLVVDQIRKEYNGRGLDAVVLVGDLSTDNDCYNYSLVSDLPTPKAGQTLEKYREEDDPNNAAQKLTFYRLKEGTQVKEYYRVVSNKENGNVIKIGKLNSSYFDKNYYEEAWNNYLKPLSAELKIPIYVVPGNHDSDINTRWSDVFGTERQFSALVKDTAIICLDTFNDADEEDDNTIGMHGHGGDYRAVDFDYLNAEVDKYTADSSVKRILIFAHYLNGSDKRKIDALAEENQKILAAYYGDTHLYSTEPYSNMWFFNDGNVAYLPASDEGGGWQFNGPGTEFGYLDSRFVWSYMLFEWSKDDTELTYRMLFNAHYEPYNMPGGYDIPEIKQDDILVSR